MTAWAGRLLEVRGTVAAAAERLGVATWHLSISHDAGVCIAMVVARDRQGRRVVTER